MSKAREIEKRMYKVEYGSIYNPNGHIVEKPAIIYDIEGGLMKCGEANKVGRKYDEMMDKYVNNGDYDMVDSLKYAEFDKDMGVLGAEEICTLLNYLTLCAVEGERIDKILNLGEKELKAEIERIRSLGY